MSSTRYDRQNSFALFSAENPTVPHSGATLDAEFNAVKVALDDTQQNLALIQDDDGVLKRGSVGQAQFDSSVSLGFGPPATWETGRLYTADVDTVFQGNKFYIMNTTHTSGASFDATKFDLLADFTASVVISDGSITAAKLADGAVGADKIADGSISTAKVASSAVMTTKIADAAVTLTKLAAALPAQIRDLMLPAGLGPLPFSGVTLPTGWDWADGGALLANTAYPVLRAQLIADGFPYGQDGSANPKKPDTRGRVTAGRDTMGAVGGPAGRLGSGAGFSADLADPSILGAVGGRETHQLTTPQIPVHSHTITDPGHVHTNDVLETEFMVSGGTGSTLYGTTGGGAGSIINSAETGITATNNAGGGAAHNNVQPTLVCNMIIKAH